jgi:hypothetical protein
MESVKFCGQACESRQNPIYSAKIRPTLPPVKAKRMAKAAQEQGVAVASDKYDFVSEG